MRLNGWQRLFVLIFAAWTVAVGLFSYLAWPHPVQQGQFTAADVDSQRSNSAAQQLRVEGPDGKMYEFPRDATDDEIRAFFSRSQANGPTSQRGGFVLRMAAGWLLPPTLLYALGWGIAWVRRGFSADA